MGRLKRDHPCRLTGTEVKGSLPHFKLRRWSDLNKRTINGSCPSKSPKIVRDYLTKGTELRLSREEFYAWCDQQWPIIAAMQDSGEKPSIDRIDPKGHYEIRNMRIRTLSENATAGRMRRWNYI